MLHPFISSARAARAARQDLGGLTTSLLLHTGLIALAIVATTPDLTRGVAVQSTGVEHLVFTGITHVDPVRLARKAVSEARRARRGHGRPRPAPQHVAETPATVPDLAALQFSDESLLAVLDSLPSVDDPGATLESMASGNVEFARDALEQFSGAATMRLRPTNGNAFSADVVEKVVAPLGANPRPRYPASLQAREIEGSFIVKFVVDSAGRVEEASLQFPPTTHRLFVKSIRDALVRSRFFPAELAGRHVAQLVQQRFSFVMERFGRE